MKILVINTTDATGGAANLTWQLGHEIAKGGNQVKYLVGYKYTNSSDVDVISTNIFSEFIRNIFGNNILRYFRHLRAFIFSNDIDFGASQEIVNHPWFKEADIVHIHNLHGHYFRLSSLTEITKLKPVVWTLHDMWAMTSHCGFCVDCKHFNNGRHFTPGIFHYQPMLWNNSNYLWKRKHDIYKNSNFRMASPSIWLKNIAESTAIFGSKKIDVIPNGVDTKIFKPFDKKLSRKILGLPLDKKIVLGIYSGDKRDKRKRFGIFKDVAESLRTSSDILFVCLGRSSKKYITGNILFYPYSKSQETLKSFYTASDLFFQTSAMENASMANLEALASGIVVIAFANSGIEEIKENHLLEEPVNIKNAATKIISLIEGRDTESYKRYDDSYGINITANRYLKLYKLKIVK